MPTEPVRFGIGANWRQFVVLSLITFWVGSVVGVERVVVPALGSTVFHESSYLVLLSFIASFGAVKAAVNLVAGGLADRIGRRPLLVVGWVVALPVPFLLATAPSWTWIVLANLLVGVNQGFAWSMSVTSKIDLAGAHQRGFASGLNEFSGYGGVAVGGFLGGVLAGETIRLAPSELLLGVILVALATTYFVARETREHARRESTSDRHPDGEAEGARPGLRIAFALGTWRDRRLVACSQAGLIEKFVDTLVWGFVPIYLLARGYPLVTVAALTTIYTASWAVLQLAFGPLSDRLGRRLFVAGGMALAGVGVWAVGVSTSLPGAAIGSLAMGLGMAMLYPTLLATVADLAPPASRGAALGVYRFWRDSGYFFGGIAIGLVADLLGTGPTFAFAGALMLLSASWFFWALRPAQPAGLGPASREGVPSIR